MVKLLLVIATATFSCGLGAHNVGEQVPFRTSPTPMNASDITRLKQFAKNYEPSSGREVIPSPPTLDADLAAIIENASKSEIRDHEQYVVLIFLKLGRFHVEHFKQSYELGRENPLTQEFYRLIGERTYERAERMGSHLAENYVKKNPNLLEYQPIADEMKRIEKAVARIENETRQN